MDSFFAFGLMGLVVLLGILGFVAIAVTVAIFRFKGNIEITVRHEHILPVLPESFELTVLHGAALRDEPTEEEPEEGPDFTYGSEEKPIAPREPRRARARGPEHME